jgi:uroporphyrinogen decarboxylase
MTSRERFVNWMHFKDVDRPPWWELWYWEETLERWHKEGLPEDVHLIEYLGVDRREDVGVNVFLCPPFKEETIEETSEYRIFCDEQGVIKKEFKYKRAKLSMPQFLRPPVENQRDFEELKKRLNPYSPARYPLWWEEKKKMWKDRDYPLSIFVGSLFGWIRNWMGLERVAITLYDDPDFIEDMMEYITWHILTVIRKAIEEVDIEYATLWEDMAYKTGPLISPAHFKKLMLPRYKRITSFLREHGIDIILVDSDGNINSLIPLWLEGGVNGVYPLERAAEMDPVALRRQYGKELLMIGGIDKRAMAQGKEAIDKELEQLPYLFASGGYIPWCDHLVPPDVPFWNYVYYLNRMKEISLHKELWKE